MVGSGAFGNERAWIIVAVQRALLCVQDYQLDVAMLCFGKVSPDLEGLAVEINAYNTQNLLPFSPARAISTAVPSQLHRRHRKPVDRGRP
ncbi:hypothetical protein [Caballeronia sp. S22]|uniref:hypothetical protein n=1 Tax=Caballeronia sp. S22 TaxID=3137182 RepID=UPI0035316077